MNTASVTQEEVGGAFHQVAKHGKANAPITESYDGEEGVNGKYGGCWRLEQA